MKKAALAFGLVVMTSVSVLAQEAAVEAVADVVETAAAVEAPATEGAVTEMSAPAPVIVEETVLDGQVVDGQAMTEMTYTAAPVADCGCGAPAPVVAEPAPVADCGCGAEPAPAPAADCGCAAEPTPAPAADCGCEPEAEPDPCCCKRERKQVVRTWISGLRARRDCCCN